MLIIKKKNSQTSQDTHYVRKKYVTLYKWTTSVDEPHLISSIALLAGYSTLSWKSRVASFSWNATISTVAGRSLSKYNFFYNRKGLCYQTDGGL